ncbi:MAG: hypothetical protein JNM33_18910, partial [Rubrivivax sp.]|nr:hypothetical protein [Rubrivivax sp.]
MLRRVSKALRLSPADDAYLCSLARTPLLLPAASSVQVSGSVMSVVHRHPAPVFVLDALFELLAFNEQADRLYGLSTPQGPFEQSQLWQVFMNPRRRSMYLDFAAAAQNFVALFRLSAVARDADLGGLEVPDAGAAPTGPGALSAGGGRRCNGGLPGAAGRNHREGFRTCPSRLRPASIRTALAQPSESFTCSLNSDSVNAVFTSRGSASLAENTPRMRPLGSTTGRLRKP